MFLARTGPVRPSAPPRWIDIWRDPALQAGLNPRGERTEVADALHFVIGQLDAEMIFDKAQELESLQAVDAQFFEEIVVGSQRPCGHLEVRGSEVENFL